MNKLMMGVQRFLKDEEGAEVVEWALVAALLVAIGAAIFGTLQTRLTTLMNGIGNFLAGKVPT